jgi:hypothetical protein
VTSDILRNDPGNALNALKSRARSTPSERLAGIEAAGFGIALAIWIWFPENWQAAFPFLALSAFGLWGLTDRTLLSEWRHIPVPLRYLLRALRWIFAAAGVSAAIITFYAICGWLLGGGVY